MDLGVFKELPQSLQQEIVTRLEEKKREMNISGTFSGRQSRTVHSASPLQFSQMQIFSLLEKSQVTEKLTKMREILQQGWRSVATRPGEIQIFVPSTPLSKETVFGQGEEKSSVKKLESDENRPEIKKETKNALAVMFPDSDSSSSASASDSESSSEASQSSSDDSFGLNSEDDLPLLDTPDNLENQLSAAKKKRESLPERKNEESEEEEVDIRPLLDRRGTRKEKDASDCLLETSGMTKQPETNRREVPNPLVAILQEEKERESSLTLPSNREILTINENVKKTEKIVFLDESSDSDSSSDLEIIRESPGTRGTPRRSLPTPVKVESQPQHEFHFAGMDEFEMQHQILIENSIKKQSKSLTPLDIEIDSLLEDVDGLQDTLDPKDVGNEARLLEEIDLTEKGDKIKVVVRNRRDEGVEKAKTPITDLLMGKPRVAKKGIDELTQKLNEEARILSERAKRQAKAIGSVTQEMIRETQELLQLFGIPFIISPTEAEAQCSELSKLNHVDGIATEDSDVFLFGGDFIYKNLFNQQKALEYYSSDLIKDELGLKREKLIEFALLVGSDYTPGIKGIGSVLALEILGEFATLNEFGEWIRSGIPPEKSNKIRSKIYKMKTDGKLQIPDNFPDRNIIEAYTQPNVDHSLHPFTWSIPNSDKIRTFMKSKCDWSDEKTNQHLIPAVRNFIKEYNTMNTPPPPKQATTKANFVDPNEVKLPARLKSIRVTNAIDSLRAPPPKPKKKRRNSATPKKAPKPKKQKRSSIA